MSSTLRRQLVAASALVVTVVVVGLLAAELAVGGATAVAGRRPIQVSPPPAFEPPPGASYARWSLPAIGGRAPSFPYLPGDDREGSRSVGDVTHGYLVDSRAVPQPHPGLTFLEVQYERGLVYTSQSMLDILEGAAAHVREYYPELPIYLGNLGSRGGGDIPYSVSHNSGRDADLAFYLVDAGGTPTVPDDLVALDSEGRATGQFGTVRFDTARNWRLVEGVVRAADERLQWIFVSRPLKRRLLEHAARVGAPGWIRRRARRVLHQPTGSLPHDDHFHLRLYCSRRDRRSGCVDDPPFWPWYERGGARERARAEATEALSSEREGVRLAGVRRLDVLRADGRASAIVERLEDESPRVRAAAARALGEMEREVAALATALEGESHPRVFADLAAALGSIGGPRAVDALAGALDAEARLDGPGPASSTDARIAVASALRATESVRAVEPLIGALETPSVDLRRSAARALRFLTNRALLDGWQSAGAVDGKRARERWRQWYREHSGETRRTWLLEGFRRAGYAVDGTTPSDVWPLCRAVDAAPHLSYNAQRLLMAISGRHPDSLAWPRDAAAYYWRHLFAEHPDEYGVPPVPADLQLKE
ncbi:MAG: penicillin-insensitive murein endopeptidase [Bradymonadaceae bacterium]